METRFGLGITAGITAGLVILAVSTESLFAARNPGRFLPLPAKQLEVDGIPVLTIEEISPEEMSHFQTEFDDSSTPGLYGNSVDEIRLTRAKNTNAAVAIDLEQD